MWKLLCGLLGHRFDGVLYGKPAPWAFVYCRRCSAFYWRQRSQAEAEALASRYGLESDGRLSRAGRQALVNQIMREI